MSSTTSHLTRAVVAGLGAISMIALAGCSAPDTGTGGDSGSAGGGTITVAETTAPTSLDPQGSSMFADRFAWQLSYECLMQTTPDGEVVPGLATGFEKSADGLTYTFALRDGVKFSNGDTFDADDVVYTFERLTTSPERIDKELFPTYSGVKKVDASTVEFTLKSPDAGFVNNMANPLVWGCAILSQSADKENLATKMIGTGPWTQSAYEPNTSLQLDRNADYWGEKTKSAKLSVLYMPNMGTQVSNLKAGKVDIIFPDQGSAKGLTGDKIEVKQAHTDSTIFMQINDTVAPFNDPKVRQALALALDRQALADQAYGGAALPSSYLPPSLAWAPKLDQIPNHQTDVEKAKKLLAEAGHPDGVKSKLMYISGYDPGTNDLLATIQSQLAAVGIEVELEPLEGGTWGDRLTSLDYGLSWNAQSYYPNPYQYVAPAPGRQGPVPAELQKLLDAALNAGSQEEYQQTLSAVAEKEGELVYPTLTLLATDMFVANTAGMTGVDVPASQSRTFLVNVEKK